MGHDLYNVGEALEELSDFSWHVNRANKMLKLSDIEEKKKGDKGSCLTGALTRLSSERFHTAADRQVQICIAKHWTEVGDPVEPLGGGSKTQKVLATSQEDQPCQLTRTPGSPQSYQPKSVLGWPSTYVAEGCLLRPQGGRMLGVGGTLSEVKGRRHGEESWKGELGWAAFGM